MSEPDAAHADAAPTIGKADATRIAVASAIAAASSTLVVAGAPRVLGDVAGTTLFLTYWSALFACFGVLSGISIESTRTVTASLAIGGAHGPRVGMVGAAAGLTIGLLLAVTTPLWGPPVFTHDAQAIPFALLVALGVAGYAVHSVVVGTLAGSGRWRSYAALVGAESAVRLVLVAIVALGTGSVLGTGTAAAVAAFTWIALLVASPGARAAVRVRADVPLRAYLARLSASSVATGASAVLMVGFATLLAVTTNDAEYATAAPLLLAITLTRAPLMIPLNAYQGVAVSHFVRNRDQGLRAMLPIGRIVLLVGALGAVAAWAVGPWLLTVIGGPTYRISGLTLAGLTLGATGLALVTLTGAVCQALTRHGAFVGGWLVALAVAICVLLFPWSLQTRAVLALLLGPAAGIVLHLLALHGTAPAPACHATAEEPA